MVGKVFYNALTKPALITTAIPTFPGEETEAQEG